MDIDNLLQEHDKQNQEPPKLSAKEKKKLMKEKKKQEKEAQIRKEEEKDMQREIDVAEKNIKLYRSKWKDIQMEKGKENLKIYMNEHWSLFDHFVDKKNELIKMLNEELEYGERVRKLMYEDHILATAKLFNSFDSTVQDLVKSMYLNKQLLLTQHQYKTEQFLETSGKMDENMRLILFLVEQNRREKYEVWGGEIITEKDEEILKNRSEIELLLSRTEKKFLRFWKDYKTILQEYSDESKKILKLSQPLHTKVETDNTTIIQQKEKLRTLNQIIENNKYIVQKKPKSSQLRDLQMERATLHNIYLYEKQTLQDIQNNHHQAIRFIVTKSNNVNNKLVTIAKVGKKILKLFKICKGLETISEVKPDEVLTNATRRMYGNIPSTKMFKFFKRMARAEITAAAMRRKYNHYKETNNDLQCLLKYNLKNPKLQEVLKDMSHCT